MDNQFLKKTSFRNQILFTENPDIKVIIQVIVKYLFRWVFSRIRILRLWLVRRTVRIPLPVRRRSSGVTRMMVSCLDLGLRRNRSSIRLRRDQQCQSQ
jgi:hypothetical protein